MNDETWPKESQRMCNGASGQVPVTGPQYLTAEYKKYAERILQEGAAVVAANIKKPIFKKRMGKGAASVLVYWEWPGVVTVFDPNTGAMLAISLPGSPTVLDPSFEPTVPALQQQK